ncbi:MAG: hypothetical protein JSW48_17265 [Betaproteobacteria bacterium]|jgi:hypothetical protein|nr:MAG: hypothetical protein JSW48_17265 [Betaproteobacteria bacterium]
MARIDPVQLDFVQTRGKSRLGQWLLVIGVLAASISLLEYDKLSEQLQAQQEAIDEQRGVPRGPRAGIEVGDADSPEMQERIKKANGVLDQLNVPWGDLFAAIEMAQGGDVALLQVQPDARSRTVLLGGGARNLSAVLDYIGRLEGAEDLSEVLLVSHKLETRKPGRPVEFLLNGRWVEKP